MCFSGIIMLKVKYPLVQPSPQVFSARSILNSSESCDVTDPFLDFARTTGQERHLETRLPLIYMFKLCFIRPVGV